MGSDNIQFYAVRVSEDPAVNYSQEGKPAIPNEEDARGVQCATPIPTHNLRPNAGINFNKVFFGDPKIAFASSAKQEAENTDPDDLIRIMLEGPDFAVADEAFANYLRYLRSEGPEKILEGLGTLRGRFNDPNNEVVYRAVLYYERLAEIFDVNDEGEITEGARAFRSLFNHSDYRVKNFAMGAYGGFAEIISPDEIMEGAPALRELFPNSRAIRAYMHLLNRLPPEAKGEFAGILRGLFDSESYGEQREQYGLYDDDMEEMYEGFVGSLNPEDALHEIKEMRTLLFNSNLDPTYRRFRVLSSVKVLAGVLNPEGANEMARSFRRHFNDEDPDSAALAIEAYRYLYHTGKLSDAEVERGSAAMSRVLRNLGRFVDHDVPLWLCSYADDCFSIPMYLRHLSDTAEYEERAQEVQNTDR